MISDFGRQSPIRNRILLHFPKMNKLGIRKGFRHAVQRRQSDTSVSNVSSSDIVTGSLSDSDASEHEELLRRREDVMHAPNGFSFSGDYNGGLLPGGGYRRASSTIDREQLGGRRLSTGSTDVGGEKRRSSGGRISQKTQEVLKQMRTQVRKKSSVRSWIVAAIVLMLLCAGAMVGFPFRTNHIAIYALQNHITEMVGIFPDWRGDLLQKQSEQGGRWGNSDCVVVDDDGSSTTAKCLKRCSYADLDGADVPETHSVFVS